MQIAPTRRGAFTIIINNFKKVKRKHYTNKIEKNVIKMSNCSILSFNGLVFEVEALKLSITATPNIWADKAFQRHHCVTIVPSYAFFDCIDSKSTYGQK